MKAIDICEFIFGVAVFGWMIFMSRQKVENNKLTAKELYQSRRRERRPSWWKTHWKVVAGISVFVAGIVGFASAVATFLPRIQLDVSSEYVSGSPFPASVTITNQLWPLSNVSFALRICSAQNSVGGKWIGFTNCSGNSKGRGSITTPDWQGHQMRTDEKWTIYVGGNIGFKMDAVTGDIRMVLRYWPWLLPPLWFDPMEKEARVVLYTKPDGSRFWGTKTID